MSSYMHSPNGDEEGEYPSTSSPTLGEPSPSPPKLSPAIPKKRSNRSSDKSREMDGERDRQLSLSAPCPLIQGGDYHPQECTSHSSKSASPSPESTASVKNINSLLPQNSQGANAGGTKGSWLQRLIKKIELEPDDMEKLDRLDQFGSIVIRNTLRFMALPIVAIFIYAIGIFAEKLRHESDLFGKFQSIIGDGKLINTLIISVTMFGTAAFGTAAVKHVRKKRKGNSRTKNEQDDSPRS